LSQTPQSTRHTDYLFFLASQLPMATPSPIFVMVKRKKSGFMEFIVRKRGGIVVSKAKALTAALVAGMDFEVDQKDIDRNGRARHDKNQI
jgi:hypothetical protein